MHGACRERERGPRCYLENGVDYIEVTIESQPCNIPLEYLRGLFDPRDVQDGLAWLAKLPRGGRGLGFGKAFALGLRGDSNTREPCEPHKRMMFRRKKNNSIQFAPQRRPR